MKCCICKQTEVEDKYNPCQKCEDNKIEKYSFSVYCLYCGKEQKWFSDFYSNGEEDENCEPRSEPEFDNWYWIDPNLESIFGIDLYPFQEEDGSYSGINFCSKECASKFVREIIDLIKNKIDTLKS